MWHELCSKVDQEKNLSETWLVTHQTAPKDKENAMYIEKLLNKYHTPNNYG